MPNQNARVRRAQRARGQHILHFLGLQNLRACQARVAGPAGNDERENHLVESGPEERSKRDGKQNSREREKRIDQHDVDQVSNHPPKYPATAPTVRPMIPAPKTTLTLTSIETRVPKMMRDRMSRPSSSVPIQCAALGATRRAGKFCAIGSYGASHGAASATISKQQREAESPAAQRAAAQKFPEFAHNLLNEDLHSKRTRGSTTAYTKSVSRFTKTYETAISRMQPCSSG